MGTATRAFKKIKQLTLCSKGVCCCVPLASTLLVLIFENYGTIHVRRKHAYDAVIDENFLKGEKRVGPKVRLRVKARFDALKSKI